MNFSGDKAYTFLEKIAIPRRTGSEGNVEVFNTINDELKNYGYEIEINKYEYIHTYLRELLIVKLGIVIFFFIMIVSSFSAYFSDIIPLIILCIISIISAAIQATLMVYNLAGRFTHYLKQKFSEKIPPEEELELPIAKNIIVKKYPQNKTQNKNDLHIIIGAHYDSISINYHYLVYAIIYLICILGSIFLGIYFIIFDILLISIIYSELIELLFTTSIFLASVVSVCMIMWLRVNLKNESQGASDNASGVSILMELARILKDIDLNFKLTMIFFGVEEEGLLGSISYVKSNLELLKTEKVMMLSLDTLGIGSKLKCMSGHGFRKKYDKELLDKLKNSADKLKIELKRQWFLYPSSDHAPFVFSGFSATQLFNKLIMANTKQDKIDKINKNTLETTGKLVLQFLMDLNES
ncbi:MAG: M28 family metallopeptidase [Candidatus Helarchaeota archaeon]